MNSISILILCTGCAFIGGFIGLVIAKVDRPIVSLPISRMPSRISLMTVRGWGLTRTVLKNDMEYVLGRFDARLLPAVMSAIDVAYAMGKEDKDKLNEAANLLSKP
jgi:hypothetical protein